MYKIFNTSGELIFEGTDLFGADLAGADLRGADLSNVDLCDADLRLADLCGANLSYANLSGANLSRARLIGADLSCAELHGAKLYGARGIISFGPLVCVTEFVFAYINNGVQCLIGGFSGNHNEAILAIRTTYGDNSSYEMVLRAAVWALAEKFGMLQ